MKLIARVFILLLAPAQLVWAENCAAPAKAISLQVQDFCFLQFETDDIAHPGVAACTRAFSSLSDTCAGRTSFKSYRCYVLQENGLLKSGMSIEQCVVSMETEGYLAQGCEYPIEKECIRRAEEHFRSPESDAAVPRPCGMSPEDWCPSPPDDPCAKHDTAAACKADKKCEGRIYTGESAVACELDKRCFASNCPTVGCVSACELLTPEACQRSNPRCEAKPSGECRRRFPCQK